MKNIICPICLHRAHSAECVTPSEWGCECEHHIPEAAGGAPPRAPLRGLLLRTDGSHEIVDVPDTWRGMAQVIGCQYVEKVNTPIPGVVFYVDEEGWLKANPVPNLHASWFYPQPIEGNALFLGLTREISSGEWIEVGLSDQQIAAIREHLPN